GFRIYFTPLPGCFSPFPHGTGSLSVTREYLALGDGPPGFRRNSSCSAVLRILLGVFQISSTGFLPSLTDFSKSFDYLKKLPQRSPTTPTSKLVGLGCSRFARRYYGNRFFFLFLQVLRCFSSLRLPLISYVFTEKYHPINDVRFPHSDVSASKLTYSHSYHIGVRPILPRLLAPRHPPCALNHLTLYTLRLGFDLVSSDRYAIKK